MSIKNSLCADLEGALLLDAERLRALCERDHLMFRDRVLDCHFWGVEGVYGLRFAVYRLRVAA